jgi:hypothetical protein
VRVSDRVEPTAYSPVWEPDTRTRPPRAASERETLTSFLDYNCATFELKCTGVPLERLSERGVPPSTLSLHGILRHLGGVESWWFGTNFSGEGFYTLYDVIKDSAADFDGVDDGDPEEAFAAWRAACERSREIVDAAGSLEDTGTTIRGETITLRWVLVNMITEYARHNGQADLLRERIDGAIGA